MIEFMDMNEDCLELVLKVCDPESLAAATQTCKTLNRITKRLFKHRHNYECDVNTVDGVKRAKSTIKSIGKYLNELTLNIGDEHFEFGSECMDVLPEMCPDLRLMKVFGAVQPNAVLDAVVNLKQLEKVAIKCASHSPVPNQQFFIVVTRISKELKQLQFFEMTEVKLSDEISVDVIKTPTQNLKLQVKATYEFLDIAHAEELLRGLFTLFHSFRNVQNDAEDDVEIENDNQLFDE